MGNDFFIRSNPAIAIRGIHLDLKGLPPASSRLFELLEILAQARINCIVVEWEDMYPWKAYPELKNETSYTESTVRKFISRAESLNIEVIPLVQSFGHMENVLSKRRFKHLREIPDNVSDLCPLKNESRDIVLQMVKDVLLTHTGIKHFHLGGDEVWSFGSCSVCKKFIEKHGKASLYLYHLEPLLQFLNERGIRPIIWDDMMRTWNTSEVKAIGRQADLMCWSYGIDPFKFVTRDTIDKFMNAGCNLWAGSAFKGADGA
ncbi:MAG: family 20 glycosylhydrolase, partial [Candidatus Ratteibacteria bacterium]